MRDIIVAAIAILFAVVFIIFISGESSHSKELQGIDTEMQVQTSQYTAQRKKLQSELEELKKNTIQQEKGIMSIMLMFTETDELFLEEIVPTLRSKGISATLCLTADMLPETRDDALLYDLQYLSKMGWQTAMLWDGSENIDEWYLNITRLMSEVGVEIPNVIYLSVPTLTEDIIESVELYGFEHIVLSPYVTNKDDFDLSVKRFNTIDSYAWYSTAAESVLTTLKASNSQAVFLVGTSSEELSYKSDKFNSMLEKALIHVKAGKLTVTTPDTVLAQINENKLNYEAALAEYNAAIADYEQQIAEINEKIDDIYNEYYEYYKEEKSK